MKLLLLLAGVLCGVSCLARGGVSLTVRNAAGCALRAAPVRGGVPFAIGQLHDGDSLQLTGADGKAMPCSTRPLAHWYDGSVKWLLVDTQVDLPAGGAAALTLTPGRPQAPARAVRVSDEAARLVVDTGAARFVFSKTGFGAPSEAWLDSNGDGTCETRLLAPGGEFVCEVQHEAPGPPQEENWLREASAGPRETFRATPAGDYRAEVENVSPLRATIKLSGWLTNSSGRKLVRYVIRAQAFAGRPELRLLITFVYGGQPKSDFIRALYLRFPKAAEGPATAALGGERAYPAQLRAGDSFSLTTVGPERIYHLAPYDQDKTVTYTVTRNGRAVASGKEAQGWARVADGRGTLDLAVRNFWQMHPKQLTVQPEALTCYLWPEQGGRVLDLRRRYDEVENTYHYDLSLWPYGGEGVGVTHELLLRLGPPGAAEPSAAAAELNCPLLLACTPQYYAASGAFGPFAPADRQRFPHLEGFADVGVAWLERNQQAFHWDGMLDYGDTLFHGYNTPSHYGYVAPKGWCSRGYVGWLNDDGGMTNALFVRYLQTGDYRTYLLAENMARHSMDVDTCHYCAEEPRFVGGGHRHDQQHWGNGTRGYGTATHGIIDYYLLTGNERALDVALETAAYHVDPFEGEDEDRVGGLIRVWEITGDAKWKKSADEILAAELAAPASPTWRFATTGHFRMVLNTCTGFMYYLSAVPPAEGAALREAIVETARAARDSHMSTWADAGGYLPLMLVALATNLSGDRAYAEQTAALLQRVRLPLKSEVPADLPEALRTMPFEDLVKTATGDWGVNNLYSFELSGFGALPYLQAALTSAGLDEAAAMAVPRVNNPAPSFEEEFDPKKITGPNKWKGRDSYMFNYTLEHAAPDDRVGRSKLLLYEDDKLLGPAHNGHIDTMENGLGRWSHWGASAIQFSTSDNSDPRTNGRRYKIVNP